MKYVLDLHIEKFISEKRIKIKRNGKIFSFFKNQWIELKLRKTHAGYLLVNYKGVPLLVHRVVYRYFNKKIDSNKVVNHKDGNKSNNKYSNLENVSVSKNSLHARNLGLNNSSKINRKIAEKIRKEIKKNTGKTLAKKYKVSESTIFEIVKNKTWTDKENSKPPLKKDTRHLNTMINLMIKDPDYEILETGVVLTFIPSKGSGKLLKKRKLCLNKTTAGYFSVRYKGRSVSLHRLIYAKFIGKLRKGLIINHKDGNPLNNHFSNLEQISYKENSIHSKHVLRKGEIKCTKEDVNYIRNSYLKSKYFSFKEMSEKYNISVSTVRGIVYNDKWYDPAYKYKRRLPALDKQKVKMMIRDYISGKYRKIDLSIKYNIKYSTTKYILNKYD